MEDKRSRHTTSEDDAKLWAAPNAPPEIASTQRFEQPAEFQHLLGSSHLPGGLLGDATPVAANAAPATPQVLDALAEKLEALATLMINKMDGIVISNASLHNNMNKLQYKVNEKGQSVSQLQNKMNEQGNSVPQLQTNMNKMSEKILKLEKMQKDRDKLGKNKELHIKVEKLQKDKDKELQKDKDKVAPVSPAAGLAAPKTPRTPAAHPWHGGSDPWSPHALGARAALFSPPARSSPETSSSPAPAYVHRANDGLCGRLRVRRPKAKIEETIRQIIDAMPAHVPKCIELYVMGEMSSTGIIRFANHSDLKIFVDTYRHTFPISSKPKVNNEPLWVAFHKPLNERRDTRILNLLAAHLKASCNSEQNNSLVVCRVNGGNWYNGKRIFAYRYSTKLGSASSLTITPRSSPRGMMRTGLMSLSLCKQRRPSSRSSRPCNDYLGALLFPTVRLRINDDASLDNPCTLPQVTPKQNIILISWNCGGANEEALESLLFALAGRTCTVYVLLQEAGDALLSGSRIGGHLLTTAKAHWRQTLLQLTKNFEHLVQSVHNTY